MGNEIITQESNNSWKSIKVNHVNTGQAMAQETM